MKECTEYSAAFAKNYTQGRQTDVFQLESREHSVNISKKTTLAPIGQSNTYERQTDEISTRLKEHRNKIRTKQNTAVHIEQTHFS